MAAVPDDSQSALVPSGAPYVGRRVAPVPAAAPSPEAADDFHPQVEVAPRGGLDLDAGAIERVLDSLEPVDHSTSFEHEPTARIPLLRADPPRPTKAGKRRAVKHAGRRGPLFKSLPSTPVLLGIAALAVSVGGVVTVNDAGAVGDQDGTMTQAASALTGSSGTGTVHKRARVVSRDSSRAAQADAADQQLQDAAEGLAEQRNTKLAQFAQLAETQAKKIELNLWQLPVESGVYHLTARFGQYGLWSSFHTGLDFAAPTGTPIHAIANGVVISASYDGAYGNKTVVRLDDGTELWYCHQNTFGVSVGDVVRGGEVIGYVGSTGHVTGPHVHIEVRPGGGDPVDPFPAFEQHGVTP